MKSFLPFTRPSIDESTIAAVAEVFRSGQIASGPRVQEFERALQVYLGGERHVRVLTSATEGLEIALDMAGVRAGDEVLVPAMSFAASANVVARLRATPVFVDVELHSRNIDLTLARQAVTRKTRAIMPVHFSGLAADMEGVLALAKEFDLRVVEDAAHAIGTRSGERLIGSFGDLAVFSFHPNKNMTCIEGGAISTASAAEAEKIELARFHGIHKDAQGSVDVLSAGGKSNLSDVAAQVGIEQLRRLDEFNARRRVLAGLYFDALATMPNLTLPARGDEGHSWHMFTVLIDFDAFGMTRFEFQQAMAKRGIGIGIHYPCIPSFTFYRMLGQRADDFPNAQRIGRQTVTLPLFPAMKDSDVARVTREMRTVLLGLRASKGAA